MTISSLPPIAGITAAPGTETAAGKPQAGDPFGDLFRSAVSEVNRFQEQAAQSANSFLSGDGEELHKVAMDAQRAELAFDLFLQTRNKVVDAYQEIMRMQL